MRVVPRRRERYAHTVPSHSRKKWSKLSRCQRAGIVVLGAVEAALTVTALVDLARRDTAEVRGGKALWLAAVFIQPVGAPAYLLWGRNRSGPRSISDVATQ